MDKEKQNEATGQTFALGVILSKFGDWQTTTRLVVGYRKGMNRNEAMGSFIDAVMKENPDFCAGEVVTLNIR